MADWSREASEYLDGYLKQVTVLVRQQGDDSDDVVAGLRDHIRNEVESDGSVTITLECLLQVLSDLGAPEEVANLDPLKSVSETASGRALEVNKPSLGRGLLVGCGAAIIVPLLGVILLVFFLVATLVATRVASHTVVTGEDLTVEQYEQVVDETGETQSERVDGEASEE